MTALVHNAVPRHNLPMNVFRVLLWPLHNLRRSAGAQTAPPAPQISLEQYEMLEPHQTVNDGTTEVAYATPNVFTKWRVDSLFTKEPDTIEWIRGFQADEVFVDIGANVGMYTIWAAKTRGVRTFAFEPESQNYALLCRNIVLNGFGEVDGPRAAVAALGVHVGYHGADMSRPAEIEAMMAYAASTFGRVDILVNNAGIQHVARIENFPPERWDAIIAINLSSAFHATRLALPAMREANWGRIINLASVHGLVASAEKSAYVAAKHGLVGLTKVTALENATTGVTCNAICPGWVLTPLVQKQVDARAAAQGVSNDEAIRQLLGEKEPSMQFTTPEELGALAVFLCSSAGNNVRGVAWNMDGGWAAQ